MTNTHDTERNRRILLIDDNQEIHKDYRKILAPADGAADGAIDDLEDALFGDDEPVTSSPAQTFELDSALQGQEALEKVRQAKLADRPFALAFVDMRMPPGWDGVETIRNLWQADPHLQVVVCTAYADYSWADMVAQLGSTDQLLILKKPFDPIEVCQMATAMTEKWNVTLLERRRMEEAVRAMQEAKAYAASLETVNRALEQAKLSADAAAKERSEFLVRMTGGILTPMSSLVEEAEKIRTLGPDDESWLKLVETLCEEGQSLTTSLQDVLDLTAIESGTLRFEHTTCNPLDLARSVIDQLRPAAEAKGLELTFDNGGYAPNTFETDIDHLTRTLVHLVGNAITYTEHGSVRLMVDGDPSAPSKLLFIVQDTGPGFSPEMRAHLFEPFCHAYTQKHDERDGAGIGLYLSKRMTRALGGELTLEPHDGTGSRLELSLDTAVFGARAR